MLDLSRRTLVASGAGLALSAAVGLIRPARAQGLRTFDGDGYSEMLADPRLTTWVRLIAAAGMESYVRSEPAYTVFPASDAAFAQFPFIMSDLLGYQSRTGTANDSTAFPDASKITKVLRSHVVPGKHYAAEVMGRTITVTSLAGTPVAVDGTDTSAVRVSWTSAANGERLTARLANAPVTCSNAVIYVIDDIQRV